MAPLHIAALKMNPALIELLLLHKKINIEITSPLHGTPLHAACLVGSVKIVQQLLLNKANINAVNHKNKLPIDLTNNQRIQFLLLKQEQRLLTTNNKEEEAVSSDESLKFGSNDDNFRFQDVDEDGQEESKDQFSGIDPEHSK